MCGASQTGTLVVTKLENGVVTGYVEVPPGWIAQTKQFSGELHLTCPTCVKQNYPLPTPLALSQEELAEIRAKLPKKL